MNSDSKATPCAAWRNGSANTAARSSAGTKSSKAGFRRRPPSCRGAVRKAVSPQPKPATMSSWAPNDFCYLDYYQTKDPMKEPLGIGGFVPVSKSYALDPYNGLAPEERPYILGVQANLWTEYIFTSTHLKHMLLPRLAAIAEVGWAYDRKDFADFKRRMNSFRKCYDAAGIQLRHLLFRRQRRIKPNGDNLSIVSRFSCNPENPNLRSAPKSRNRSKLDHGSARPIDQPIGRGQIRKGKIRKQPAQFPFGTFQPHIGFEFPDHGNSPIMGCPASRSRG